MPARAKRTRRTAQKGGRMAEETTPTATEQVEGSATEPQGDGAKAEDWKARYDELLKQTRKHEDRAKANYAKAKAYDEAAKHAEEADGKLAELTEKAEKAEAELAAMRAEREREQAVAEVAKKANVPADVLKLMRGDTAEELEGAAEALSAYIKSLRLYPEVPDGGARPAPPVTRESISAISDRHARMKARRENADIYR